MAHPNLDIAVVGCRETSGAEYMYHVGGWHEQLGKKSCNSLLFAIFDEIAIQSVSLKMSTLFIAYPVVFCRS